MAANLPQIWNTTNGLCFFNTISLMGFNFIEEHQNKRLQNAYHILQPLSIILDLVYRKDYAQT